jgi:hypothetical protein
MAEKGNIRRIMKEANIEQQNRIIEQWIPKVRRALRTSARRFPEGKAQGFVTRGKKSGFSRTENKLAQSIKSKTKKSYGAVEMISFTFERHGVFVHKGVGRGYPVSGSVVINNPSGKTRKPVEWFNPIVDKYFPQLADKIAGVNANAAVNATRLKIT